ncbi:MAG: BrnT family toxin [Candidatus Hydrogenedentes bacterium]|nr:BrnT family toxin [Candidatus Hydrogenedentota bacterium]
MRIEWDPNKAQSNLRKHRVSFQEAAAALWDAMSVTGPGPDHSFGEFRYVTFGMSERGRVLAVSHTEEGETIRIISARVAGKGERRIYEEG